VLQNNTTMLASGAAVLYLISLIVRRGLGRQLWIWAALGVVLGLGMLLQLSAVVLAAPAGLALVYEAWRQRRWQTLAVGGAAVAVPLMALTGWWIARNFALYGDWSGNSAIASLWCCDPIPYARAVQIFLTGLLGRFGQGLMITYPQPVYIAAGMLALVALAGHLRPDLATGRLGLAGPLPLPALRPRRTDSRSFWTLSWLTPDAFLWLAHAGTILAATGALVFYAVTVAPGLPGRYMFPAFPSLAVGLAAGWLAWFRPRRRAMGIGFLAGLSLAAALYALCGLLWPTYRLPRAPTQAELRAMTPVDAQIEATARVLGYQLSQAAPHAGEQVTLTVYWQPLARTAVPYTVFVHLLAPGVGSVVQRDTYPGLGNYATTVWDVGRPFVDSYTLAIPPEAGGLGQAQFVFGLYDGASGLRLPVTGRDAGSAEEAWVRLRSVDVR
jgi:4-amino-4-deoxy-L-arabinose transferase-like glycosyltransferase